MTDLEEIRLRWLDEQPLYEEYGKLLAQRISLALKGTGVWFEVSSRSKSVDSLIKKLIKKPQHTFESIPDKIGVRVIVRYRSDLEKIIPALTDALHCGPIDLTDTVGYLSVHVDFVRLKESEPEQRRFPVSRFWAELQLRTQAQHLWSEMSHDSIYKNDEMTFHLPDDIKRRVNLMAGQIEVADREFDRLASEGESPREAQLLRFLESYYYRLTSRRFDVELSLIALRTLFPLLKRDLATEEAELSTFLQEHLAWLERRYKLAQEEDATGVSTFFFQPEALLIYKLLSDDETSVKTTWGKELPEKELTTLGKDLGFSL
jgi:ppGpp synthetase/RelA/SpoT-type nucleotidyltranferase